MFGTFSPEQHVKASRDIGGALGPLGYAAVKRGTRGIVRATPSGFFGTHYTVEFANGSTVQVRGSELRRTAGHGDAPWRRGQEWRSGLRIGVFLVIAVPLAWTLIRYYLAGGSTSGLIAALPQQFITTVTDILSRAVSLLGLPVVAVVLVLLILRHRHRD